MLTLIRGWANFILRHHACAQQCSALHLCEWKNPILEFRIERINTARKLRTALRTAETSSYTYFGVLRRSPSLSKLFSVLLSWPLTR
jgi:hypothetical protein